MARYAGSQGKGPKKKKKKDQLKASVHYNIESKGSENRDTSLGRRRSTSGIAKGHIKKVNDGDPTTYIRRFVDHKTRGADGKITRERGTKKTSYHDASSAYPVKDKKGKRKRGDRSFERFDLKGENGTKVHKDNLKKYRKM